MEARRWMASRHPGSSASKLKVEVKVILRYLLDRRGDTDTGTLKIQTDVSFVEFSGSDVVRVTKQDSLDDHA